MRRDDTMHQEMVLLKNSIPYNCKLQWYDSKDYNCENKERTLAKSISCRCIKLDKSGIVPESALYGNALFKMETTKKLNRMQVI